MTAAQAKDVSFVREQIASLIEFGSGANSSSSTTGVGTSNAIDFTYVLYGESSTDPTLTSAYFYSGYYNSGSLAKNATVNNTKMNISSLAEIVGVSLGELNTATNAGLVTNKSALGLG